jgi:uncharacterized membrane protein
MMPAPYDPTRQHSTNDLSRSDYKKRFPLPTLEEILTREQRQDRASMVREAEQKGRDLIHAYGDARVNAYVDWRGEVIHAAKAADAFAKLMLLVSELARVAYE